MFFQKLAFLSFISAIAIITALPTNSQDTGSPAQSALTFLTSKQSIMPRFSSCPLSTFNELFPNNNKYVISNYLALTDDGYYLVMFRVNLSDTEFAKLPPKLQANKSRVIQLQHGLFDSADTYFENGESGSLGFHLVQNGFDVWLGNNRGNKYSVRSVKKMEEKDFFDFSFTEFGQYDTRAFVKKIKEVTQDPTKRITWIGHSEGTTQMFIGQTDPLTKEYLRENIERFIALAPIAYMTHVSVLCLKWIANLTQIVDYAANEIGIYEVGSADCTKNPFWDDVVQWSCDQIGFLCDPLYDILGYDPKVDNVVQQYAVLQEHNPSGASIKQIAHYGQLVKGDANHNPVFRNYDYGFLGNLWYYKSVTPPNWEFGDWVTPLSLLAGTNDGLGTSGNIDVLRSKLPKGFEYDLDYVEGYSHSTWMYAIDPSLYFPIIDRIIG